MARVSSRALLGSVVFIFCTSRALAVSLDDWVKHNTKQTDVVLCKRKVRGEYFLVARAGRDRIKLATRLDVTRYSSGEQSDLQAWTFLGDDNQSLSSIKMPPTLVNSKIVTSGARVYAETVEYQKLRTNASRNLRVSLTVKKCASSKCDLTKWPGPGEEKYTIDLCKIRVE